MGSDVRLMLCLGFSWKKRLYMELGFISYGVGVIDLIILGRIGV